MTVKKLINELKKMPQNLKVFTADHDHGQFETNSIANYCELIDKKEMTESSNDDDSGLSNTFKDTPIRYVVVRP